jgi:hypothetical protein
MLSNSIEKLGYKQASLTYIARGEPIQEWLMLLEWAVYILLPPLHSRDPVWKARDNDNWEAKGKLEKGGGNTWNTKRLIHLE